MSMVFVKEKSVVKGYLDGKYTGCFDFATGKYYGIRGNEVKRNPRGFCSNAIAYSYEDKNTDKFLLLKAMNTIFEYEKRCSLYRKEAYSLTEQLLSIGLYINSYSDIKQLIENKEKFKIDKDFINYYKDTNISCFSYNSYLYYLTERNGKKLFGENRNEYVSDFVCRKCDFLEDKDKKKLYNLIIKEKVNEFRTVYDSGRNYNNNSIFDVIKDVISLRQETKTNPVIPDRNLYMECCMTMYNYRMKKNETNNALIRKYNDNEKLYYENDDVVICPLLSIEDFHDEATKQNNCVERLYMEKVIRGETHIVHVRKKDNLDKSFITCEVSKFGIIKQFLYSHNRPVVYDEFGTNLLKEYQKHLYEVWDN